MKLHPLLDRVYKSEDQLPHLVCSLSLFCSINVFLTSIVISGCVHPNLIGNGVCNDEANTIVCNYDGGDCCGFNINKESCIQCTCAQTFNEANDVSLTRGRLAKRFNQWGEEFTISFEMKAIQYPPNGLITSILHFSKGGEWGQHGDRIPALFTNQKTNWEAMLEFRSSVAGDHDDGFDFRYQLNTVYQIEISQTKYDDTVTYRVKINNATLHSVINTQVQIFPAIDLYLTSPWKSSFGQYGTMKNLLVANIGLGKFTSCAIKIEGDHDQHLIVFLKNRFRSGLYR